MLQHLVSLTIVLWRASPLCWCAPDWWERRRHVHALLLGDGVGAEVVLLGSASAAICCRQFSRCLGCVLGCRFGSGRPCRTFKIQIGPVALDGSIDWSRHGCHSSTCISSILGHCVPGTGVVRAVDGPRVVQFDLQHVLQLVHVPMPLDNWRGRRLHHPHRLTAFGFGCGWHSLDTPHRSGIGSSICRLGCIVLHIDPIRCDAPSGCRCGRPGVPGLVVSNARALLHSGRGRTLLGLRLGLRYRPSCQRAPPATTTV
mmetsp:Transcript_18703/g.60981  ORF Transcript_18703/g.60981 Transcript_18703/m.60981 type:complete len:257 (-) Transcript_18703:854-1624(-)